jgi:DNA-binding XRE family transcriptional regulator
MAKYPESAADQETFRRLKEVRAQALEHYRMARLLHAQRQDLIRSLTADGFSQADIAREMGVTRQAIQKMLT